jgi:hypothetical protein
LEPQAEMQSALATVKKNLGYVFVVFGIIWVAIAFLAGSLLVLWPAVALAAAGVLIKLRPKWRLSIAWGPAAAILGLLLCGYQVYEAAMLVSGTFVTVASASVVLFFILGLGHLYLAFASYSSSPAK